MSAQDTKPARPLTSAELAACCGGCRPNSAIETWMQRAIAKFCEVNGIPPAAGVQGTEGGCHYCGRRNGVHEHWCSQSGDADGVALPAQPGPTKEDELRQALQAANENTQKWKARALATSGVKEGGNV